MSQKLLELVVFFVSAAFVGGLVGTISDVRRREWHGTTGKEFLETGRTPSHRWGLVFIFALPTMFLANRVYEDPIMDLWLIFAIAMAVALGTAGAMYLIGRSVR